MMNKTKKISLSALVIALSAFYVLYQSSSTPQSTYVATSSPSVKKHINLNGNNNTKENQSSDIENSDEASVTDSQQDSSNPTPTQTTPVTPPPPQPTKQTGQYNDGVYVGSKVNAYYGIVQVQATVKNGKLVAVDFLSHPSSRSNSVMINTYAMPILKQEAIQAQSANVQVVSGASLTSPAFIESLGNALDQAKI